MIGGALIIPVLNWVGIWSGLHGRMYSLSVTTSFNQCAVVIHFLSCKNILYRVLFAKIHIVHYLQKIYFVHCCKNI